MHSCKKCSENKKNCIFGGCYKDNDKIYKDLKDCKVDKYGYFEIKDGKFKCEQNSEFCTCDGENEYCVAIKYDINFVPI